MQNSISKAAFTWRLLLSLLIIPVLISCEENNTVGGGIIDPVGVRVDTLYINDFSNQSLIPYSGNVGQIPVGYYQDRLLGTFESIGYIKPELVEKTAPLNLESVFRLVLHVDNSLTYGDTTQSLNVDIFQIDELWRGADIRYDDELSLDQTDLIGSFSYQNQDSIEIELSDSLLIDYLRYYNAADSIRDSLYNFEFFGFALVPESNDQKIIYPDFDASRIYSIRQSNGDTISIPLRTSGFNLKSDLQGLNVQDRIYLNSNLEKYVSLNLKDLALGIGNENLLEAELIFHEDIQQLRNSVNLPDNHVRQTPNFLDLKNLESDQEAYEMQFQASDIIAIRDSINSSFSFNITDRINNYIFNGADSEDLYLNINPSGGRILSTLIFDSTATNELRPKIVLKVVE